MAPITIFPLPSIPNTPFLSSHPHRTTLLHPRLCTPLHTILQQIQSLSFFADTGVDVFELNTVLQRAVFDKLAVGDALVRYNKAGTEAKGNTGIVGEEGVGAEGEHVAKTFSFAVHAVDAIIGVDAVGGGGRRGCKS